MPETKSTTAGRHDDGANVVPFVPARSGTATVPCSPSFREGNTNEGTETPAEAEQKKPPKRLWGIFEKVGDFMRRAELEPPLSYLIDKQVPTEGRVMLVGINGSAKTWYALLVSKLALALDRPVYLVEEEGSTRGLSERLSNAGIGSGDGLWVAHNHGLQIEGELHKKLLAAVRFSKRPVIVLDCLAKLMAGDEDKGVDCKPVQKQLDELLRVNPRLLLVLIHHMGKAGGRGETSASHAGRGSTTWPAWTDTQLNFAKVPKRERGVIAMEIHVAKQRDDEDGQTFVADLGLGTGEFRCLEKLDVERNERHDNILEAITSARGPLLTKDALAKAAGGNRKATWAEIDRLEAGGQIVKDPSRGYIVAKERS